MQAICQVLPRRRYIISPHIGNQFQTLEYTNTLTEKERAAISMQNKRATGAAAEKLAAEFLVQHGAEILERNFRTRRAEIDLIAMDQDTLVFIEVKYRHSLKSGYPEEAVDQNKQRRIHLAARVYMSRKSVPPDRKIRFDVVSLYPTEPGLEYVRWIRNAF